ncbi:MAG: hypothetical protein WBN17_02100 [Aureibaculum sp.]
MKRIGIFCLLLMSSISYAQIDNQPKFWDNVRFGGGFGLGFGNNNTTIAISPSAIYTFDNKFALGLSTSYLYNKNFDLNTNVFGAGIIGLYNPLNVIQLSAEFEQSFARQKLGLEKYNFSFPALYLGIAYRSGWFAGGLRYDVLYDSNKSVYASALSPIVRFYF